MAQKLVWDFTMAGLDEADTALCRFAVKATVAPAEMDEGDVAALHRAGFDDEQISLATQVVSYFNYINRVADALGVEPESWMSPSHAEWERGRKKGYADVLEAWERQCREAS